MRWVDVNEYRPIELDTVLVACKGGMIMTSKYWGRERCESSEGLGRKGREYYGKHGRWFEAAERGYVVLYWMPLPSAPKGL